jgi:predicted XRE-type DNA-binding protein
MTTIEIDGPYASIWDAICDTPEEVEEMKLRSSLFSLLREKALAPGITIADTAKQIGGTHREVQILIKSRFARLSLERLVAMALRAGIKLDIKLADPHHSKMAAE